MTVGANDGDDVNVKGDDGSARGGKITATTDGSKKRLDSSSKILGHDGSHHADIFLEGGVRKLQTSATATVESVAGKVVFPFTFIKVLTTGANGDTLRVQIPADSIDITITKTASEVDVHDIAQKMTDALNASGTFTALYEAETPRDSHEVCISSILIQTIRNSGGSVVVTSTGSLTFTLFSDRIIDHSLSLALFPHPRDCSKGTINVTGEIGVLETGRPPRRLLLKTTGGSSHDMGINGATTPVVFKLSNNASYDPTRDFIVTELRIEATANTITNGSDKYVGVNALTNGHLIQVRSDGALEYDENMLAMHDIFHSFSFGVGSKFDLQISSGDDVLVAVFARPFFIRKVGTFATADDIIVTVRDDLSSTQINRLQMSAVGFED